MSKEITKEQKIKIDEIAQKNLSNFYNCPELDREAAIELAEFAYTEAELDKPRVIFAKSPRDAQNIAKSITGNDIQHEFSIFMNACDLSLLSLFEFLDNELDKEDSNYSNLKKYMDLTRKANIYDSIQGEDFCIIIPYPEFIHVNANDRFHCATGPCCRWKDAEEYYYWNGVQTEKRFIENKESITIDDIINTDNVEQKRVIQEILGDDSFAKLLTLEEIDRDTDESGNPIVLFQTKDNISGADEGRIFFVKVICPSSDREYYICVPSGDGNVWSARSAVAWTFGMDEKEYAPDLAS